jgi:cytochrome c
MHKMKSLASKTGLLLAKILSSSSVALGAGDPEAGKSVFAAHCAVCHATAPGENKIGPSLAGIVGSKSGTVQAFNFSAAMKDANVTWDDADLDRSRKSGRLHSRHQVFVNLPSETDRQNVIAYLNTLKK